MHRHLLVALIALVACAGQTLAQNQIQVTSFDKMCTLVAGEASSLAVLDGDQRWAVNVDSPMFGDQSKTSFLLTGTGRPSLLAQGTLVSFAAMVDSRGRVTAPVEKLTIISANSDTKFGLLPYEQVGGAPADPKAGTMHYVVGVVTRYSRGEITVQLPTGRRIEAKLVEEPLIDVRLTGKERVMPLLQPGDKIQVKGFYKDLGTLFAQQITVARELPLGEAVAKSGPVGRRPGTGGTGTRPDRSKPGGAFAEAIAAQEKAGPPKDVPAPEPEKPAAQPIEPAPDKPKTIVLKIN